MGYFPTNGDEATDMSWIVAANSLDTRAGFAGGNGFPHRRQWGIIGEGNVTVVRSFNP
jgi:hypothetical protein